MFDPIDGIMLASGKKNPRWKKDLCFTVKLAWQKLSNQYAEGTPMTGVLLISAHILDPFHNLRLIRLWDKLMVIDPEDETSYTTQYQEVFLKNVENEYWAKYRHVPVIEPESVPSKNLFPSATSRGAVQSSVDPYDSSGKDEKYLLPNNVAETTPGYSDHVARLLKVARLNSNLPPQSPKNRGQINSNPYDYHSDPMEISSKF